MAWQLRAGGECSLSRNEYGVMTDADLLHLANEYIGGTPNEGVL